MVAEARGRASGAAKGYANVTHPRFEAPLSLLLPNGPAWPRDDATLRKLIAAITVELSRIAVREGKLDRELNPATTFECLTDWEESYGLPDCAQPETLEARRAAVAAKLLAQTGHDQSLMFWMQLLEALTVIHYIDKGPWAMECNDDCMDQLFDEWSQFVWKLAVDHGLDDALLECLVAHNSLIGTVSNVHYLWTPVPLPEPTELYGVASTNDGFTAVVGTAGKILYVGAAITDITKWNLAAAQPEDVLAICAVDKVLIAVGVAGVNTIRSTNGGATWTSVPIASGELYALSRGYLDNQVAVAVGEDGKVWRTPNAGTSWIEIGSPTTQVLRGVGRCEGALVAVGDNGAVIRSTTNGSSWALLAIGAGHLCGVAGWLSTMIAVGLGGKIWRSKNNGATWSERTSPTTANLYTVTSSPTGRWTAGGAGGVIIQSYDDGVTWDLHAVTVAEDLHGSTAHVPSGRAILVGNTVTILVE